jgi:hypothetical protein
MLRKRPGTEPGPYHPTPNPSAFVGVSADFELMLWSMSEFLGL